MRVGLQDLLHHLCGVRTHGTSPLSHARRRPIQVRAVRGRPVLGVGHGGVRLRRSHVRGDTLPLMEDLDGRGRGPHFHRLTRELVGTL